MSDLADLVARLRTWIESVRGMADQPYVRLTIKEAEECADALKTLQRENEALKHDLARHVAIASEEATRADGLTDMKDQREREFRALMEMVGVEQSDPSWTALEVTWDRAWNLAAAAVVEQCAQVCERHYDKTRPDFTRDPYITTLQCAAAIRSLQSECKP